MTWLWVALAGGVGAGLRLLVDSWGASRNTSDVPLGTMTVNTLGSFGLGVVTALAVANPALGEARLIVGVGLLGGFTTFSTACVEIVRLGLRDGSRATLTSFIHSTGMVVLGLLSGVLGLWLGTLVS